MVENVLAYARLQKGGGRPMRDTVSVEELLEPIADSDTVCAIGDFARTVILFFITMLCVGTMYFLLIAQIMLVGNLTVLLR